ncbi:MAG: TIGR04283 family arsenosugar biosynthesis glycosyltransferase [Smithellaceae bacterium]|nr:TIGR04283 family arsenosugar biosynthesis glycosyltransferase [Smithellaceae bacterium]
MAESFSIIIPVYREEAQIDGVLANCRALEGDFAKEIIVVDGGSGETLGIVSDPDVIKLRSPKGRGVQMNTGAAFARGDVLIFLHADTRLPAEALMEIASARKMQGCQAGAFQLSIASPRPVFRLIEKTAALRSRLTGVPYGDQTIFLDKDLFSALDGFRPFPVMEDVDLMRRAKKKGKVLILGTSVVTSARRWEREGIVYCTLRNWLLMVLYLAGVSPQRIAKFYS